MLGKILRNDFKKNIGRNMILLLFMTLLSAVAVSVCLIIMQLFASISDMYETAKPPYFLQMHKGELNQRDIDEFNEDYPGITYWQTVPMIDIYGEELTVRISDGKAISMSDCSLDISFVRQNEKRDLRIGRNLRLCLGKLAYRLFFWNNMK